MLNKKNISILVLLFCIILFYYFSDMGCPILFFTGIPCLGCGMTRACISMIQLDFYNAFHYHPLCFFLPFIAIILLFNNKLSKKIYEKCLIGIVSLFVIIYLLRLFNPMDTIVKMDIHNGFIYKFFNILFHY